MTDEAAALHADPERAFDGQYQLGSEIGAGALGVVYRGVDEKLDKQVAIKVWHARFEEAAPQREQYDNEARALTALEHPNLVAITDYGIAGKAPYLIMELLEGETLDARMRARALTSAQAQSFMQSVLRALGYMHMRGVVHRNLKSENIFLQRGDDGSETLKVLDLGLESLAANSNAAGGGAVSGVAPSVYDAPEQQAGADPDGRTDVYAAGVLMLHMLSGRVPAREELAAITGPAAAVLAGLLPSASSEVKSFIAKAVAAERPGRFGNADQMLRALLELPTPWVIGGGSEAAPPMAAVSERPKPQPAHVELVSSDTLNALAEGEHPQPENAGDADLEFELGPIGLVARLRRRKKLLLIVGSLGLVGLTGAVLAALLGGDAATEPKAAAAASKPGKAAAKPEERKALAAAHELPAAGAVAPVLQHTYKPEDVEEIEEGSHAPDGKAAPAAKPEEPSVHLAQNGNVAEGASEPAAHAAQEHAPAAALSQPPAAAESGEAEQAPAKTEVAKLPAAVASGETPKLAAAAEHAEAAPFTAVNSHGPAAPSSATEQASAGKHPEPGAQAKTPEPGASPPAAAAEQLAKQAESAPTPKKPATPQGLGSQRRIDLDSAEIRQMLALAIAPKPRVAAANPWDIAVPGSLQALRDAIARGERGTPGNIKALRRYNAANPDDVYGHLLLAGFYANRGYSLDALDQYDMAYQIDPSSRGAPEMLTHTLTMVAEGIAETDAARFVERVFGREAQAAITQQLRAPETTPAGTSRLKRLQARLGKKR